MEDLTKSWNRLYLHEGESKGLQLQPNTVRAWYGGPIWQYPSTAALVFTAASPDVAHFGNESIDCCEISGKKI